MNEKFPKEARLLRPPQFRRVFDHGRSRSDARLIVYACPRDDEGSNRLGLVVGRKYGNSPKRNLWKRRVRTAFRTRRAELPPGHDLIVLPVAGEVPSVENLGESLVRVAAGAAAQYRRRGPR